MNFVKLTNEDGEAIYVNITTVGLIAPASNDGTRLWIGDSDKPVIVREDIKTVARFTNYKTPKGDAK